jgi:hypothetical protein
LASNACVSSEKQTANETEYVDHGRVSLWGHTTQETGMSTTEVLNEEATSDASGDYTVSAVKRKRLLTTSVFFATTCSEHALEA